MDYSPPGFSIHGIFQARILEQAAISFSKRCSRPRDWTQIAHIVGRHFTVWATRDVSTVKQKPSGLQAPGPAILMWWIQIQNTIFLIPEYILLNIIYEKLYCCPVKCIQWGFPGGSVVKNMPSKQERQVQSLGLGRPLRKEMATHSSIHTWEIPWKEEQGRLQSWSHKIVRHNLATKQQQQSTYNS